MALKHIAAPCLEGMEGLCFNQVSILIPKAPDEENKEILTWNPQTENQRILYTWHISTICDWSRQVGLPPCVQM